MARELLIRCQDGQLKTVLLTGGRLLIGRASAAGLCFPEDEGLSKKHFAFEPEGEVHAVETPAGEAAVAVHVGPYDRMKDTHDAIHAWRAANNRTFAGKSWEIYGDWSDDPAKLETTIVYLLK